MRKTTTTHSTSDLSPKHQTSDISLKTSDLMLKHQKWQHCCCLLSTQSTVSELYISNIV